MVDWVVPRAVSTCVSESREKGTLNCPRPLLALLLHHLALSDITTATHSSTIVLGGVDENRIRCRRGGTRQGGVVVGRLRAARDLVDDGHAVDGDTKAEGLFS